MTRRTHHRTALGDALARAALRRDLDAVRANLARLASQIATGRAAGCNVEHEEAALGRLAAHVADLAAELEALARAA